MGSFAVIWHTIYHIVIDVTLGVVNRLDVLESIGLFLRLIVMVPRIIT